MKYTATFRFIIAAMAAIPLLASCRKELVGETVTGTTDGIRVISVQFDNSTKASLNGLKLTFTDNDRIRVSNSEKSEVCTVTVSGASATFTTTLPGELTAIYPAAAAVMSDGVIQSPYFKVASTQTGKVEDAIIAKATIANDCATFKCQTALFEITPSSTAKKITVTSLKKVVSGSRTGGTAAKINTEGSDKTKITVGDGSTDLPSPIYVAFVPGVIFSDLSFDAGETIGMKGIPTSKAGSGDAAAANTKYTIDGTNWHPYVTIGGKKWATMNIGASSETDYGYHFFWGGTKGYKHNGSNWVEADATSGSVLTDGFALSNTPYYDNTNSKYTKYTGTSGDGKTVLELADDAAYANWGGPWRMPTGGASGECQALQNAAPGVWTEGSVNGRKFTETSTGKTLFFPAAGNGYGTGLRNAGKYGSYWSSSLHTGNTVDAYSLDFFSDSVYPQFNYFRYCGFAVRPVSDL